MCDTLDYKCAFPKWETIDMCAVCAPSKSEKITKLIHSMIPNRESAFKKLKSLGNILGIQGIDLFS